LNISEESQEMSMDFGRQQVCEHTLDTKDRYEVKGDSDLGTKVVKRRGGKAVSDRAGMREPGRVPWLGWNQ